MTYKEGSPQWRPAANTLIPPGDTDLKKAHSPVTKLTRFTERSQAVTTNQKTSQPVVNHWIRANEHSRSLLHPNPDVNQSAEYNLNIERGHRDSVTFGPSEALDTESPLGETLRNTQLGDEYENRRTRGIPGYTGKQPLPHQKRPIKVEEVVDPSKFYGKGGACATKVWSKGIAGYTGHQPAGDHGSYGNHEDRHGVYMLSDPAAAELEQEMESWRGLESHHRAGTTSGPLSSISHGSHRKLKKVDLTSLMPEDIARRKIEEALEEGQLNVDHDGSAACLQMATKFHRAADRGYGVKPPVDSPKRGPIAEGPNAWKSGPTQRGTMGTACQFDWFMDRPQPVDKRPERDTPSQYWKTMSDIIDHEGENAGNPKMSYRVAKNKRSTSAYGGVRNEGSPGLQY